jgi:hypothetical protein
MARLEADEQTKATYFLLLHSEFYNALEKEVTHCFRQIASLGHDLGLHFDASYYDLAEENDIEVPLQRERFLLEEICGCTIHTFSFHIPTPYSLRCVKSTYAGLLNVNAEYFRKDVGYCSDSNGYWRFRRLEEVLSEGKDDCLQVLTHPEMWQDTVMSPRERVLRCISGRAEKTRRWYDNILAVNGRQNIDWD